jgi:hypothetical protein
MFESEKYIGRILSVKINDRNNLGKIDKNKFTFIIGYCTFAGYNINLNVNQITINRMPLFEDEIFDVKIIE